jgi:hypothetical protein
MINDELRRLWEEAVMVYFKVPVWTDRGNPWKVFARITSLQAEIWTQNLPPKIRSANHCTVISDPLPWALSMWKKLMELEIDVWSPFTAEVWECVEFYLHAFITKRLHMEFVTLEQDKLEHEGRFHSYNGDWQNDTNLLIS